MNKSENINELASALCKAQNEMTFAKKDSNNPFFKSKYADLASVMEALKKPFSDNGLSFSQLVGSDNGMPSVTTVLMHVSGQFLSSCFSMAPVKNDPQSIGSCITYMRRYALAAIAGIAQDDDDANSASTAQIGSTVKPSFRAK